MTCGSYQMCSFNVSSLDIDVTLLLFQKDDEIDSVDTPTPTTVLHEIDENKGKLRRTKEVMETQ